MSLKSNFASDLKKEQQLSVLLDVYYTKHLKQYSFERVHDIQRQMQGIDLIFTNPSNDNAFFIDEKAQLDYVNEDLPTFAFELNYQKKGVSKKGWLFDVNKKTHFYALVTAIYSDEPNSYTSCKITFVNREKLICFLKDKKLSEKVLESYLKNAQDYQGKMEIKELHLNKEGYLYFSHRNKAEKPVNLILKLDSLIENGIAKRLI